MHLEGGGGSSTTSGAMAPAAAAAAAAEGGVEGEPTEVCWFGLLTVLFPCTAPWVGGVLSLGLAPEAAPWVGEARPFVTVLETSFLTSRPAIGGSSFLVPCVTLKVGITLSLGLAPETPLWVGGARPFVTGASAGGKPSEPDIRGSGPR